MLRKVGPMRLMGGKESLEEPARTICPVLFEALSSNSPEITYPEPIARPRDLADPAFAQFAFCDSEDHKQKTAGLEGYLYSVRAEIGSANFRIYRIALGNQGLGPAEDVIYGERKSERGMSFGRYAVFSVADGYCKYRWVFGTNVNEAAVRSEIDRDAVIKFGNSYFLYSFVAERMTPREEPYAYRLHVAMVSGAVATSGEMFAQAGRRCSFETQLKK